jgi:transposase
MLAAGPPRSSFGSSNPAATPGAIAASRRMPAAFTRPRAWHLDVRAGASGSPSWRSLRASPSHPAGRRGSCSDARPSATEAEAQQLTQLQAQSAEVAEAIDLAQDFTQLVRQRQPEQLDPWLKRATTSAQETLQRLARGLYEDYDAVKTGVTLPWSSGPVEGHINHLKMLKRQMFGRSRLDLLSRRFVLAPREGPALAVGPRAPSQVHAVVA